jgi:nucleoid DNA-binding protein
MKKTNDLLNYIAKSRRFTKEDVKIIIEALIEYMEICAENQEVLKVRGFGVLSYVPIPARNISGYMDKQGVFHEPKKLPPAIKVNFRLAENIRRYGQINSRKNISSQEDFDENETLDNIED